MLMVRGMTPPPRPHPSKRRHTPDATGELTPTHGPTPKETEAHDGGVDGGPSVTEFVDRGPTHGGIVGGDDIGDRAAEGCTRG